MSAAAHAEADKKLTTLSNSLGIPNQARPFAGILVGGQPAQMDIEKLKALGFKTVISLRSEFEERQTNLGYNESSVVKGMGLSFVRIPILDRADLNEKNLNLLDMALAEEEGKIFIHCANGNRVGTMLALRAFRMQKIPVSEALNVGKNSGLNPRLLLNIEAIMRGAN